MKKFLKSYWGLVAVIVLSLFAVQPFFAPGLFPMHDNTQVVRVFEMGQSLKDGHFPVRWAKDLGYGYGYPLFNFYAPLPYYMGGFLNLVGTDALLATKLMMITGILLSAVLMYFLAREFWGEIGAIVSGLLYLYVPYHAVDIYVRGAVGEFWAMAFIPLLFHGLWKVYQEQKRKWVIVGALGFAGIIMSHNLTAFMTTPFILIATLLHCYIAYKNKNLSSIIYYLSSILLGFGLSSFYWVPALFEIPYTNVQSQIGGGADFRDHFVCIGQFWESQWGFGGSIPGCIDGLSFRIGKLHIITSFIILLLVAFLRKKIHNNDKYYYSELIVFGSFFGLLVSIFFMLEISRPLWESIYPMAFIQYPWRFLLFASFFTSFLAGAIVRLIRYFAFHSQVSTVLQFSSGFFIIVLVLFFNLKFFQPQTILPVTADDYLNEANIKWTTSKISDEYMPKDFDKPMLVKDIIRERAVITRGEGSISQKVNKTQEVLFTTEGDMPIDVHLNIAYFPSWKTFIDGKEKTFMKRNDGLLLSVPSGTHEVRLVFTQTPIQNIANIISISGIMILFGILLRKQNEKTF